MREWDSFWHIVALRTIRSMSPLKHQKVATSSDSMTMRMTDTKSFMPCT